jgi:hypothetical protein
MVHGMSRLLIVLLVLGSQLMLMSCASHRVALTPLTETERLGLGTIGIVAEASRLEALYSRDSSIIDDGLRAMQDRLSDAGQGAIDGAKRVYRQPIGTLSCRSGGSRGTDCLMDVIGAVLFKGVVMTGGAIVGGVVGAIDRKTYSYPPLMELPERAAIQAAQESIDVVGLPARLRDQVWERVQGYQTYHVELVAKLPSDRQKTREESNKDNGARYWPLRDQGIQTLLKVRIPLIEFRGSDPEDSFRLFVHIETTLLSTVDQSCIRHRIWEYRGESYPIAEWCKENAKLLIDELDRGLPLIAQRVTQAFFEQPSLFSLGASIPVTPKSESLACRG